MTRPNLKEIEWAIAGLEEQDTSESRYILLAALHICRDHMLERTAAQPQLAAYAEMGAPMPEPAARYGDSDFLQTVSGKDTAAVWSVMDEHMDTLRVVNPRAYESVMRKLGKL